MAEKQDQRADLAFKKVYGEHKKLVVDFLSQAEKLRQAVGNIKAMNLSNGPVAAETGGHANG